MLLSNVNAATGELADATARLDVDDVMQLVRYTETAANGSMQHQNAGAALFGSLYGTVSKHADWKKALRNAAIAFWTRAQYAPLEQWGNLSQFFGLGTAAGLSIFMLTIRGGDSALCDASPAPLPPLALVPLGAWQLAEAIEVSRPENWQQFDFCGHQGVCVCMD